MAPSLTPESPALTRQQVVLTLAGTLLAMFLAALDQTVVATAGPDIQRSLHLEPGLYTWITTAARDVLETRQAAGAMSSP